MPTVKYFVFWLVVFQFTNNKYEDRTFIQHPSSCSLGKCMFNWKVSNVPFAPVLPIFSF